MSEAEQWRQARYPGIRPASAKPRSVVAAFDPPFQRPGVDAPVSRAELADVAARSAAWAAKREKKPQAAVAERLTPQNHMRMGDAMPVRAERVEAQLRQAGAQGEAARRAAAARRGKEY